GAVDVGTGGAWDDVIQRSATGHPYVLDAAQIRPNQLRLAGFPINEWHTPKRELPGPVAEEEDLRAIRGPYRLRIARRILHDCAFTAAIRGDYENVSGLGLLASGGIVGDQTS